MAIVDLREKYVKLDSKNIILSHATKLHSKLYSYRYTHIQNCNPANIVHHNEIIITTINTKSSDRK